MKIASNKYHNDVDFIKVFSVLLVLIILLMYNAKVLFLIISLLFILKLVE